METPHHAEQRKQHRQPVRWPIHASGAGFHLIGAEVRDISGDGLFVRPSGDEPLPGTGSRLRLTVFPNGSGAGVTAIGAVRWSGRSQGHDCRGLGIHVVENRDLILRLARSASDTAAN